MVFLERKSLYKVDIKAEKAILNGLSILIRQSIIDFLFQIHRKILEKNK
jgi:hypothetical protein